MKRYPSLLGAWLVASAVALGARAEAPASAQTARTEIESMFGFVPGFLASLPEAALPGAWQELKNLELAKDTALPPKLKQAIGYAVAAQVPCRACSYAHRQLAKQAGASDAELGEALMMAALTRHWSTVFHGLQIDFAKFRAELLAAIEHAKLAAGSPAPQPAAVTDDKSALQDIAAAYGLVPEFLRRFPAEGIAGAWREERDVEMSPATELSSKHKSLISLAVASQIPCRFCILADTEFAKLAGATERELAEAVAVAAVARHWATYLNGIELDEKAFRKDIDRMAGAAADKPAALPKPAVPKRRSRAEKPRR